MSKVCNRLTIISLTLMLSIVAVPAMGQKEKDPTTTKRQERLQTHAVAGLAGLNIYSTFGAIGLTAQLYEAKHCDAAKVQQISGDVVKTCDLAIELLKTSRRGQAKEAHDVPFEDLIKCYYLLDREARLLAEASKSGDKEHMQAFHQARNETWTQIKDVLGIDEKGKVQKK